MRCIAIPGLLRLISGGIAALAILAGSLAARANAQSAAQALTNDDVIKMVSAKLSDTVVISKIKASACRFDTGPDALVNLKKSGASDSVIEAISTCTPSNPAAPVATPVTEATAGKDASPATPAANPQPGAKLALADIRTIYIAPMPNDLDQYIKAEISKQMPGRLTVVLSKDDADAVLMGTGDWQKGTGAAITGRYLGLHDTASGSVSLVAKGGKSVLWSSEAGDRSLVLGAMKRGGPRKVADRLVHNLKKAMGVN